MSKLVTDYAAAAAALQQMEAQKDGAYLERNRCAALIARMALANGWRAGVARTAIEGWSADWHGCVYVDLPTGQTSWHFHDSQAHLFAGLPAYPDAWDGHDTPEKYRRVGEAFKAGGPLMACRPSMKTELLTWHALPAGRMPEAEITVLAEISQPEGGTEVWPAWWSGVRWIDAGSGWHIDSERVVAWANRPAGTTA